MGQTLEQIIERFGATRLLQWALLAATALALASYILVLAASAISPANETPASRSAPATLSVDIQRIERASLFGQASTLPSMGGIASQLPWTLQGVFINGASGQGSAIIDTGSKAPKLYKTGQELPGGATLAQVYEDHVIINRNGSRETLRFPVNTTPPEGLATLGSKLNSSDSDLLKQVMSDESRKAVVRQRLEELRQRSIANMRSNP